MNVASRQYAHLDDKPVFEAPGATQLEQEVLTRKDNAHGREAGYSEREERKLAVLEAQIGEYEIGRLIGSGMIGVVAIARHHQTKEIVVLKCMSTEKIIEKNLMNNVQTEIDIHYEMMDQPYVLPLLKTIVRDSEIVMVTPYIPGRDLYKFMMQRKPRHLTEPQAHMVFKQLLSAIRGCHERRIIHRDIKPENIMID